MKTLDETIGQVGDVELIPALQEALAVTYPAGEIDRIERRLSPYTSSFPIEELDVYFTTGHFLPLIFKNLDRSLLVPRAARAKPHFITHPDREIHVYERLLTRYDLGTAKYYGSVIDPALKRHWLFIERIDGLPLAQVGDFDAWLGAARWLARFQSVCSPHDGSDLLFPLHQPNRHYYTIWMNRAEQFLANEEGRRRNPGLAAQIHWLADRYGQVADRLEAMSTSIVHGEFFASNILVGNELGGFRIAPLDWEMAGVAPGLLDLAAIVAGKWSEDQRDAMVRAYYEELAPRPTSFDAMREDLLYCRLYLAVQWLGWFGRREPYKLHAQDWLGEAVDLATRLEL